MLYSWDDLRIFLSIVETGSFRATANAHALAYNTVRARVARLEDVFGFALLTRGNTGVIPTPQGLNLQKVALEMKNASNSLLSSLQQPKQEVQNHYVITASEGLATVWLVPQLKNLFRKNPELEISIHSTDEHNRDNQQACDFSIQLNKPTDSSLASIQLGYLHLQAFASRDYVAIYGLPRNTAEAIRHRWVLQNLKNAPQGVPKGFFGDDIPKDKIAFITNCSSAHFAAIVCGLGLGILPNYAAELNPSVCPINIGLSFRREVWLIHPPELSRHKSAKKIIDWICHCFDQNSSGYFDEKYGLGVAEPSLLKSGHLSQLLLK